MAKILVVDDNQDLLALMEQVLRSDHTVITADSGERAIEMARSMAPAIAIVDIQMPHMDGIEAATRIKEELGDAVSIIMLSAMAEIGEARALASGCCDSFIAKPATLDDIRNTVEHLLAAKTA